MRMEGDMKAFGNMAKEKDLVSNTLRMGTSSMGLLCQASRGDKGFMSGVRDISMKEGFLVDEKKDWDIGVQRMNTMPGTGDLANPTAMAFSSLLMETCMKGNGACIQGMEGE